MLFAAFVSVGVDVNKVAVPTIGVFTSRTKSGTSSVAVTFAARLEIVHLKHAVPPAQNCWNVPTEGVGVPPLTVPVGYGKVTSMFVNA